MFSDLLSVFGFLVYNVYFFIRIDRFLRIFVWFRYIDVVVGMVEVSGSSVFVGRGGFWVCSGFGIGVVFVGVGSYMV